MLLMRRVYYSLVLASISITISRTVSTSASGSGLRRIIMAEQVYENIKSSEARLPKGIRPVHYDLRLKPNFKDFTFEGRVSIKYQTDSEKVAPKKIVLNANNLQITSGSLVDGQKNSLSLKTVTYNNESETASLEFDGDIKPEGIIHLNYMGTLNDKMKGFYRTSFEIDGVKVYAATTKFEPTDARQCLPCWDEPAIKATFSVTLVIDKYVDVKGKLYEQVPLSNMPEISRSGPDSELEVKFDKTPMMSTYLLACIVGPFQMIESLQNGTRPIRVYTTPGKQEQGRFALDVASKSLPFYENYFGIAYPLPKMDLIAIPDFISGAMENWGLVTYRETTLLVDPNNTTTARRQYVAIVVAHELAHQWFGNLVTMEWWTHLWLNEGFASFMEYLCVDHIFPEWDVWSQFVADDYVNALALDSLHNSHPIEVPVKHPSEIGEIFDIISYNKGSSVLRMLYTYLGDENFRKGMKDYLTKFAYMNTQTEDLWDCLGAASNKPVRQLMHGWTAQMGYPWLSIEYTKDGSNVKLRLTQNKFSADGKLSKEEEGATWMVPISVVVAGQKSAEAKQVALLEDKSTEIMIEGAGDSWIKLNPGTIGLYRSAYPDEMLNKLLPAISSQSLAPMDRLGIQCDYYALCQSGNVSTSQLLSLLEAYKSENSYPVWRSIDGALSRLSVITSSADFKTKFQAYGRELLSEIFQKLSWSTRAGEHDDVAMTRALLINRLIAFGDQKVIDGAIRMFKAHVAKSSPIPADLRGAVYRAASAYGDEETFESLFTIYRSVSLQEEKDRIAMALGFTRNEARRKRVIQFVLSDEVRNQDKPFAIFSLCATSPESGWQLLKDNKDWFRENYGTGHLIRRVVKFGTENFASHERADEVKRFFEENKFPGCERTIQQSLETIRSNADWLKRDADSMRSFLAAKY